MPAFFDFTQPHMVLTGSILVGIIVVFSVLNCILRYTYKGYGQTRQSQRKGPGDDPDADYLRVGVIARPHDAFDRTRLVHVLKEVFAKINRSAERVGSAGKVTIVSSLARSGPFSYAFGEAKARGWRTVGVYETDFQRTNPCFRCSKFASIDSSYGFFSSIFRGKSGRTLPDAIARRSDILIFLTASKGSNGNSKNSGSSRKGVNVNREDDEEAKCAAAYDGFKGMKILYCLDGDDYDTPKKAGNFNDALFGSGAKGEGSIDNTKPESAKMKKRNRRLKREEQLQAERANGNEVEDIEDEMDEKNN